MNRLLKLLLWGSVVGLALSLSAPFAARTLATEVTFLSPASPEIRALNKELWVEGDSVMDIYGVAAGEPVAILFPDDDRLIRPSEDPSLTLYVVDKQRGDNPLQAKMVSFFAKFAALGFLAGIGLALTGLWWRRRKRGPLAGLHAATPQH